ncbi:MAG: hypothetical protein ACREPQ_09860 [Rhodanobacter sp.]
MKERPILFSAPMVRAILEGHKTVTRRVVKPQPTPDRPPMIATGLHGWDGSQFTTVRSPYGQPGDRLWVRETHAIVPRTAYACSVGVQQVLRPDHGSDAAVFREGWERCKPCTWRPSIHMPRWASRITLEVTGVRVERLHDITEQQAFDEGIDNHMCANAVGRSPYKMGPCTIMGFAHLWETINGPGSWDANPWVWVIELRRIEDGAQPCTS